MTIKTFDANRVGGGTFSLEQDATTGEYKLKEVGFVKLPTLKLPEIEQAAYTIPKITPGDTEDDTSTDQSTFTQTSGDGGGDRVDLTGATQFKNIKEEATGGDLMKDATTLSDNLNKFLASGAAGGVRLPQSTFSAEAEDSLEDRQATSPEPQKQFASQMIAERKASQMGPGTSNPRRPGASFTNNQGSVPEASQALDDEYYGFDRLSNLGDFGGSMNQMSGSMPSNLGDRGKSMNRMSGSMPGQLGDTGRSMDRMSGAKSKNLIDTAKDVISSVKSVSIADVISKAASMSPGLSVVRALGSVNEAANTENTTALRSAGYITDFKGKIIGKDGQAVSAADSVFGGMNSRSAFGDVSKGAQNRVDTRNTIGQARVDAKYGKNSKKSKEFANKTKDYEKELMNHNNERVASREDKSGATGKNKGGFTNPGANSYGPHSGGGGDNGCFIKGTLITMFDGSKKPVEQVDLGDNVAIGGNVFAVGKFLNTELYDYKGIKVSGSHMVNEDGTWIRVRDTKHGKSLGDDLNTVYVFGSENRRILIDNILFTDYFEVSEQDQLIEDSEDFFNNWKSYGNNINEHNVNTLNAS